jgi:hypothetical protein
MMFGFLLYIITRKESAHMNTANGHKKVTLAWEIVTVEKACEFIESMENMNRPVIKNRLDSYIKDRKSGKWRRTTTPIKFDYNGRMFDGQHRCWMVIETGEPFEFLVARGCDPEEREVQDTGAPRSVRDILSFRGVKVKHTDVAVANAMARSYQLTFKPTRQEQQEYYLRHREAIEWVVGTMWKRVRGIGQAALLAPVARAWYSEDRQKLGRFLEVFREGIPTDDSEHVIVLLRNYALERAGNRHADHFESYGKAERALRAYLDGERLKTLKALSQEIFPVPGENGAKKPASRKKVK